MSELCKEFQKIEDEFNERIEEFWREYTEVEEKGNVNLGGGKDFFEELEKFKSEIIEKKEKLFAKTPEDITSETRVYLGKFENGDEEIFENLKDPLFINEEVNFSDSEKITKIPSNFIFNKVAEFDYSSIREISKDTVFNGDAVFSICEFLTKIPQGTVFNGNVNFTGCTSLTEISENVVFNGDADFFGCTFLNDETIEQLKQMKSDGRIKGVLTLPDSTTIQ